MKVLNRAKSLYTDEYFISENVKFIHGNLYLLIKDTWRECEASTRALNFDDMLDCEDKRVFASLQEDGRGGDICSLDGTNETFVSIYQYREFCIANGYQVGVRIIGIKD